MEAIVYYNDKEVTRDFSSILKKVSYTDELEHQASSIDLVFEDEDRYFLDQWKPTHGDTIDLSLKDDNDKVLSCGRHWIDFLEYDLDASKYDLVIKGMSMNPTHFYMPESNHQLQGMHFREAMEQVARDANLTLAGEAGQETVHYNISPKERPLTTLMRLCERYGYVMKVYDNVVQVYKYDKLATDVVATIKRADILSANITESSVGKYKSCEVKWYNSATKKAISGKATASVSNGTNAVIWRQVNDVAEAKERAAKWLEEKNKAQTKIQLSVKGDVRILSGIGIKLSGFGQYDNKSYVAKQAKHIVNDETYITNFTLNEK